MSETSIDMRVAYLERRMEDVENLLGKKFPDQIQKFNPQNSTTDIPKPSPVKLDQSKPSQCLNSKVFSLFMQNWPAKLGILFILLAAGWFLKYSFSHYLLSENIRLSFCLVTSMSVFSTGGYLLQRKHLLSHLLVILGSSGILLSFWFGQMLGIFSFEVGFTGMFLVAGSTAILAIQSSSQCIATFSTIMAFMIPLFSINPIHINVYSLIIASAAYTGLIFRAWVWPLLVACIGTYLCLWDLSPIFNSTFIFVAVSFLLFISPWIWVANHTDQKWHRVLPHGSLIIFIACLNTYLFFRFIDAVHLNMALLIVSGILLLMVFYISRCTKFLRGHHILSWTFGLILVYFLRKVISLQYPREVLTGMYFLGATLGVAFADFVLKSPKGSRWLSFVFLLPILRVFMDSTIIFMTDNSFTSQNFLNCLFGLISTVSVGFLFDRHKEELTLVYSKFFYWMAFLFGFILIWKMCGLLFPSTDIARGAALIVYTIIGVGTTFYASNEAVRKGGLILIAAVGARLLYFEIWEMSTLIKMITFLFIGTILLLTPYFFPSKRRVASSTEH